MRALRTDRLWQAWPLPLRWAVALSVAVHLLVLFPLGFWLYATPVAMPQAPLSAVLRGPGDVVHQASRESSKLLPLSAGAQEKPIPPRQHQVPRQAKEAARATEKPAASPTTPMGVAQGDPAVTPNAASRAGTQGGAPESAREGVDADALQRYRLALGTEARKARRYPEVSRARGHEGLCEVFVVLSRAGAAPVVIPGKTSGSPTLDEAALTMARVAVERTPVPAELQGRHLKIPLRIRFTLDDF